MFALGFIRLQFEYGRDYNFVRQQVTNRLKDATLPATVTPVISPAGGISEILRYQLKGPPGMDLIQLKTIQDWVVERKLRIVPGVADVSPLGGKTKEYQAEIDLDRMRSYGLTLPQIINAISTSNANVGGRTIAVGEQSVNVRGVGVLGSISDINNIVVSQQGGLPVVLSDIAQNQVGFMPRLGIAGRDDQDDILFGIVLMQKLERTMDVVTRVRAAIERINSDGSLPPGVKIEPFYDRGDLVAITVRTVMHNMLFGIALIFLIQWIFLGNLRCALIVCGDHPGRAVPCRHHHGACAAIRPICCRSAPSISASSSTAPSSWWKTSSAISRIIQRVIHLTRAVATGCTEFWRPPSKSTNRSSSR